MKSASVVAALPLLALLLVPASAFADGFVAPSVGVSFGGSAGTTLIGATKDASKIEYGVAVGWMGKGIAGVEGDISFAPTFFGEGGAINSTRVVTGMVNLILGIPIGGQTGGGVRPFGSIGVGLIHRNIDVTSASASSFSANDFGYDVGAGIMGYFSDHYGLRGEVQYLRNFQSTSANTIGLELGTFNYFRGSIGFLFRF